MKYNPKVYGANCSGCPLSEGGCAKKPVGPQYRPEAPLIIVADSPGHAEVIDGRPLTGMFGHIINTALKRVNISPKSIHSTNASACMIPRQILGKDERLAYESCRPRLIKELGGIKSSVILAVGGKAFKTLTGKNSLGQWMGIPLQGINGFEQFQVIGAPWPTYKQVVIFEVFLRRALALADGKLSEWEWPEIHTEVNETTYEALCRIRDQKAPVGFDVETIGIDPITGQLMCASVANKWCAVSIPWEGYDSKRFGWSPPLDSYELGDKISRVFRQILSHPDIPKVMHNCQHDLLSAKYQKIDIQGEICDTLIAHHTVYPEMKHDLGYVATQYFHAPKWKSEFKVTTDAKGLKAFVERDPLVLRDYNAKDAYMTALIWDKVSEEKKVTHKGEEIYAEYMACNDVAIRMRDWGAVIDHQALSDHRAPRQAICDEARKRFEDLTAPFGEFRLGKAGMHNDLKELFFKKLKVKPTIFSEKTGEPSLNNAFMQSLATGMNPIAAAIAKEILRYRKAYKVISTYIDKLPIASNGKLLPSWKVYGTVTGRWSSSDPNFQNWPKDMRNAVVAREGRWVVGADYSQLELRIMALIANDAPLLNAYWNGEDVHKLTAMGLFNLPSVDHVKKKQRQIAKTVEYGFNYNASDDVTTVWRSALKDFPDMTIREMKHFRKRWFEMHPAIMTWQRAQLHAAHSLHYVEEPVSGRREHFRDGIVDPNKALNFPVQSFAGWLMNQAMLKLNEAIEWGDEGILAQVHDAAYIEVLDPHRGAKLLTEHMAQDVTLNGHTLDFPVDVEVGPNMRDLKPYEAYLKVAQEVSIEEWYYQSDEDGRLPSS